VLSGKFFKLEEVDSIWHTPWETRPKFGLLSPNKTVIKERVVTYQSSGLKIQMKGDFARSSKTGGAEISSLFSFFIPFYQILDIKY
jgi:hypothetical protein